MKLRRATIKDINEIAEVEYQSSYKWGQNKKDTLEMIKDLFNNKSLSYILENNEKGIGYFSISFNKKANVCYFDYLAVKKEFQGKGFSKILIKKAISIAKEMNFNKIQLGVWAKNFSAISLYTKFGFYVVKVKNRHYKNGDDKLVMEKKLK